MLESSSGQMCVSQENGHLKLEMHLGADTLYVLLTREQAHALAIAVTAVTLSLEEDPSKH